MKRHQFIVTGVSTAGKSTFSHKLVKKYFVSHISIDPIIEGFEDVFPKLGIKHHAPTVKEHIEVCQKFKPFILRVINGLEGDDFVIEGFKLPLEDIHKKYPNLQYFVFGIPNTTPKKQLARCRKSDVDNWTNAMSDEELLKLFKFFIDESRRLKKLCKKLKIPFFDTSKNYFGTINKALKHTF